MYFGGFLLRRSGAWPMWLAFRSTVTAASAVVAGWIVKTRALPVLTEEVGELGLRGAAAPPWLVTVGDWLPLVGVPGLALGIAALAMRSVRPVLAVLAAVASVTAIVAIVGTLVGSLLPMYQMPRDLNLGR